jgi:beta-glucosidase
VPAGVASGRMMIMRWPADFMWGTGASSTQREDAAPGSDWWDWEHAGHVPKSGERNGFGVRFAEDLFALRRSGSGAPSAFIEWARLEPEPGVHDDKAIAH